MPTWDLQFLVNAGVLASVPAGAKRKFFDYVVPANKFFALDPTKPFFARPGVYEVIAVTGPSSGGTKDVTLGYPIARPPEDYEGTVDLVVKAYADTNDDGTFETKLTVTVLDYEAGTVRVTLPSGWDNTVTHNVRFSYTPAVGFIELFREMGIGSSCPTPRKVAEFAIQDLNTKDLIETPIRFGGYYWLVEGGHLTGYVTLPEVEDHTIYLDTDVVLGVSQFSIPVILGDLELAEMLYRKFALTKIPSLYQAYPTLHKLLVATLAGLVPEPAFELATPGE